MNLFKCIQGFQNDRKESDQLAGKDEGHHAYSHIFITGEINYDKGGF